VTRTLRLAPIALTAALLASCGGTGSKADDHYKVTLRYCSSSGFSRCNATNQASTSEISASQRAIFQRAADHIQGLITAGLAPAKTRDSSGPLTCYKDDLKMYGVRMDETVHGLLVLVVVEDLGSAATLASSGPCMVRGSNGLPLVAVMKLNTADVAGLEADGRLETVAFHELFHTLGFGTVWTGNDSPFDLVSGSDSDPRFLGHRALAKAKSDNGAPADWTSVPLEGGSFEGTSSAHWRQSTFASDSSHYEIMTGYVAPASADFHEQLSATTLGSLADLGYQVDYTKADAYTIPNPSALRALVSADAKALGDDVARIPVAVSTEEGEAP
jgi:hypothetical protein